MKKNATLLLIAVLALSRLVISGSVFAQSITKPSIPEFEAEYIDNSYDIAPTYTIDPYTNNTIIKTYGDHVDNRTIVVKIKNEPFTPFTDSSGNTINMFYNVRYKGTYGKDWTFRYGGERMIMYSAGPDDIYGYKIQDYASQNTIIVIESPAQQGQMDIQVETLKGYTNQTTIQSHIFMSVVGYTFYGEKSGWSNTQTLTIGETQMPTSSPAATPTLTPTVTPTSTPYQIPITIVTFAAIVAAVLILLVYLIKRK